MISLNYITVSINPTVLTIITDKTIIAIITILIVDIYLYPQLDIYIYIQNYIALLTIINIEIVLISPRYLQVVRELRRGPSLLRTDPGSLGGGPAGGELAEPP